MDSNMQSYWPSWLAVRMHNRTPKVGTTTIVALMKSFISGISEFSLFGLLCTTGGLFGPIMSGSITDYLGRSGTMGFTAITCLIGWIAIAFSQEVWSLYVGRLLVGAGMHLISYVIPVYAAEIMPQEP